MTKVFLLCVLLCCVLVPAYAWGPTVTHCGLGQCMSCIDKPIPMCGCSSCPPGTWKPVGPGGPTFKCPCQDCAAGKWSAKGAACQDCPAGKWSKTIGAAACQDCAAGKWSAARGALANTTCQDCAAGKWSAVGAPACQDCAAGKWSAASGALANTTCQDCPAGKWSKTIGAAGPSTCTKCLAGRASPNKGAKAASDCAECVEGQYAIAESSTCTKCLAGRASPSKGGKSSVACIQCAAGRYSTTRGSRECTKCPAGTSTLNRTGSRLASACHACLVGRFSDAPGAATCEECSPGRIAPLIHATSCSSCGGVPDVCTARGTCVTKLNGCKCRNGWDPTTFCATCRPTWENADGTCSKCAKGLSLVGSACIDINKAGKDCRKGYLLNTESGSCVANTMTTVIYIVSIVGGVLTLTTLLYKMYLFQSLKRNGRLNPDMLRSRCGTLKVLYAVFAYGDSGKHVVGGDMEASLLEKQVTDLDRRESIVEMTDKMDEFLDEAGLGKFKQHIANLGVESTEDLQLLEDEDLESAGVPLIQRKKFKMAINKQAESTKYN